MGAAVAMRLLGGHAFPDYDATYALIWGRDLAHGHSPDYSVPLRPAGHPLLLAFTTLVAPLGRDGAAEALRWLGLLGGGALVAATWRLARELAGPLAGGAAALLLATRSALWGFSLLGFVDCWAAALVLWAALLELRTPRRGAAVFVLLGLAGLIRPEVWLFAGAYWLWLWTREARGRALRLLPLAALGPLAWIAFDLATTQTFLGSLFAATDAVGEAGPSPSTGGHGVARAPGALARFVGGFVRPPEALAAAAGLALAAWRRSLRMALPAALIALNVVTFAAVALRRGPLEQRYLLVACAAVLVFAAYVLSAWGDGRLPRVAAAVLALACVAYAPVDVHRLARLHDQVAAADAADSQLRALVRSGAGRCALRGAVQLPDVRLRPFIAYWAGVPPQRIGTKPAPSAISATTPVSQELLSRSLPEHPAAVPAGAWRIDGACARQ